MTKAVTAGKVSLLKLLLLLFYLATIINGLEYLRVKSLTEKSDIIPLD